MHKLLPLIGLSLLALIVVLSNSSTVTGGVSASARVPSSNETPDPAQEQLKDLGNSTKLGPPGVYLFYDWRHLNPKEYPIVGGHFTPQWKHLQIDQDQYNWKYLHDWLAADAVLGKTDGLGLDVYQGACCGGMGVPDYVFMLYPRAKVECTANGVTEEIPKYWDPGYQQEYGRFIQAFGAEFNGDPRLSFVEIGVGIFGETQPAIDAHDTCLQKAGLTSELWVEYAHWVIDQYLAAFPDTQLVVEFAPRYLKICERKIIADYAAERGVGLQHSGLKPDADMLIIDNPNSSSYQCGQYDPILKWGNQVVIGWEGTETSDAKGPEATMWRLYNGLDKHPDFILLDDKQVMDPARWKLIEFATAHSGRTLEDTPSVWVALRETEYSWYPDWGNFEFWLYQDDSVVGGKTIPLWRVGSAPEGRYTRRTDSASDNEYMYFKIDDGYLFDTSSAVTLTVTYLDQGHDTWELQYDSTGDIYRSAGVIKKANTSAWISHSFTLTDARFANRQAGNSDFRIWNRSDGDEIIHFVQVVTHDRPYPTPRPSLTPAPTHTATPTPPPSATPGPPPPPEDCPRVPDGLTLDGHLDEWQGRPSIVVNHTTAEYINSGTPIEPTNLSAEVWCGWQGNDLILAARIDDDLIYRDSASIWHDDSIEFSFDGLSDGWVWGSPDDHQFTVATDGWLTDLGTMQVPGASVTTQVLTNTWSIELYLPQGVINAGALYPGRIISFTVGLNDDDNGGSRDDHMIWRGQSTNSRSEEFGALRLSGLANTPTPTPSGGSWPSATPTPTETPTPTPSATPTATEMPTATPTATHTRAARTLECPALGPEFILDADLTEWATMPGLMLDRDVADYVYPYPAPDPTDLSGQFYCGWIGDDLILAGSIIDNVIVRDSDYPWLDDSVEFGIDGAADRIFWNPDDHQITLVTDGAITNFGTYPVDGATNATLITVRGWQFEMRLPSETLQAGTFYSGKEIGFTVGLNDDDDGDGRDAYMVWEGETTYGAPENYGRLILTGTRATSTPTPEISATATAALTDQASVTPTSTRTATLTVTRTPTVSATSTVTPTPTVTATRTATTTPTATHTASATSTPTATAAATRTATATPTVTHAPTATRTHTPTATPTIAATSTATPTPTATVTLTATSTHTATATSTATPTATNTSTTTSTPTPTATHTPTATPIPTTTHTPTATPTITPSTGALIGVIYWDLHNNNGFDPGADVPLSEALLRVRSQNGDWAIQVKTTSDGTYHFDLLQPATYTLEAEPPPGFILNHPQISVAVAANVTLRYDFAAQLAPTATPTATRTPSPTVTHTVQPSVTPTSTQTLTPTPSPTPGPTSTATPRAFSIQGRVWADLDANQTQGSQEYGIPEINIALIADINGDGKLDDADVPHAITRTDPTGDYAMAGVPLGIYLLVIDLPREHAPTTPAQVIIKSLVDQQVIVANFGIRPYLKVYMPMLLGR